MIDMNNNESYNNNIEKCPHYNSCNQNLCPLDVYLESRSKKSGDKCRWMRPPKQKIIMGRVFLSGGKVMPNGLLKYVPESNLKWLNESSQREWRKINNKQQNESYF